MSTCKVVGLSCCCSFVRAVSVPHHPHERTGNQRGGDSHHVGSTANCGCRHASSCRHGGGPNRQFQGKYRAQTCVIIPSNLEVGFSMG